MRLSILLMFILSITLTTQTECIHLRAINYAQSVVRKSRPLFGSSRAVTPQFRTWLKSLKRCLESRYDSDAYNCFEDDRLKVVACSLMLLDQRIWIDKDNGEHISQLMTEISRRKLKADTRKDTCQNYEYSEQADDDIDMLKLVEHVESVVKSGGRVIMTGTSFVKKNWKKVQSHWLSMDEKKFNKFKRNGKQWFYRGRRIVNRFLDKNWAEW